mmetsp:Transcript_2384/g.8649  ORF Transcript_2384/g.8649 Transcript_2384/m.8649 type:complete len:296 (+) Transcript_2384:1382-2269(+)
MVFRSTFMSAMASSRALACAWISSRSTESSSSPFGVSGTSPSSKVEAAAFLVESICLRICFFSFWWAFCSDLASSSSCSMSISAVFMDCSSFCSFFFACSAALISSAFLSTSSWVCLQFSITTRASSSMLLMSSLAAWTFSFIPSASSLLFAISFSALAMSFSFEPIWTCILEMSAVISSMLSWTWVTSFLSRFRGSPPTLSMVCSSRAACCCRFSVSLFSSLSFLVEDLIADRSSCIRFLSFGSRATFSLISLRTDLDSAACCAAASISISAFGISTWSTLIAFSDSAMILFVD